MNEQIVLILRLTQEQLAELRHATSEHTRCTRRHQLELIVANAILDAQATPNRISVEDFACPRPVFRKGKWMVE